MEDTSLGRDARLCARSIVDPSPIHLPISAIPLQKACQISALYISQLTLDGVCAAHASVDSTE